MAASTTVGTVRKYLTAAARVKLDYEPHRHITNPYKSATLMLLGGEIMGKNSMGQDTVIQRVPGLIKKRKTNQMRVRVLDNAVLPYKTTSAAAKTGIVSGTGFTHAVASGKGFKASDTVKNLTTGALLRVTAVSGNTLTLMNQAGGASGNGTDNIADGDVLMKLAGANGDFWTYGTGISSEPEEYYNYCQTRHDEYGIGILGEQQEIYPKGSGLEEDRLICIEHHNFQGELQLIDGVRGISPDGEIYTADGLRQMAEIVKDAGGTMTYETFIKDLEKELVKPGDNHWMCGTLVKANAMLWNDAKVQTSQSDKVYGSDIERIKGVISQHILHVSEVMDNYPGEALIFKPENLEYIYLGALDTVHMENVQSQNTAGTVNAYVTSCSLLRTDEDTVTRLVGFNG